MFLTLRKFIVPSFLAVYVLLHIVSTQFFSLSPWKGGGFGMYSTYHPGDVVIWLQFGEVRINADSLDSQYFLPGFKRQVDICKTLPTEFQLRKLLTLIKSKPKVKKSVEVWKPIFNVKTGQLKMELVRYVE